MWGITASDSRKGYVAWGGPPRSPDIDGSVVPSAAAGSLMFTPEISVPALREMRRRFGGRIYGRYGFTDAFHPTDGWVNPDVIGIDLGDHAAQCREPPHRSRLVVVHDEPGDAVGDGTRWPDEVAPLRRRLVLPMVGACGRKADRAPRAAGKSASRFTDARSTRSCHLPARASSRRSLPVPMT